MTQKEFNEILFARANMVEKSLEDKVLTDAGLEAKYTQKNLWFECTEFNDRLLEFTATNFTFKLYIENGGPSTHIVHILPELKLNSNSKPVLRHDEIDNMVSSLLTAEKIINSLIKNKELIAKSTYDVFNSFDCIKA